MHFKFMQTFEQSTLFCLKKLIVKIQVGVDPVFEHIFGMTGIQKNRELIFSIFDAAPRMGFLENSFG